MKQNPALTALVNELATSAGVLRDGAVASPEMLQLARLVAGRCLDILETPGYPAEHYAAIAQLFDEPLYVSSKAAPGYRAALRNAPQLSTRERALAEFVFAEVMRQKIGDVDAMHAAYHAWHQAPAGDAARPFAEALVLAHRLVTDRLGYENARPVALGTDAAAYFEIEFLHDVA
jgi:hypothetical protein